MAAFVRHEACPKCGSKDNLAVYDDGSFFCFSHCGYKSLSQDYKEELDSKDEGRYKRYGKRDNQERTSVDKEIQKSTKPAITEEEKEEIKGSTSTKGLRFRGIRDDTSIPFGVRYGYNSDGEVIEQFYPVTQDGQLVGYKIREVPKNFRSIGRTGADCECFMQFKFNRPGKYVLICEGEADALSAYQMLNDYNKSRGSDFETAVVSPTTGAMSKKQIANNYKFFDQFDNIILCMDNDEPGKKAEEELLKHLPKGKVKVMRMRFKDPNEYLMKGKEREFVQDFYAAEKIIPAGVLPSSHLYDRILGQAEIAKVPFPTFMGNLNEMFAGGMPLGHIINIAADTGIGKTVFTNEMVYFWIFNSPHKIGVVSMELDAGQYGEALLSRHLQRKLALIKDHNDKITFLKADRTREQARELFTIEAEDEDGLTIEDRFLLLDNRDGDIEEIQDTIEEMVVAFGVKIVILDPLQDLLDGLSNEEQAVFMKWAKGFIKSHGVTFVFINHMRKTPAGQSGADNEQNIMGSSTIIKSASANILLKRDKMAEDPIVRNTTEIMVTKNRVCGITGPAGAIYYDNETHTLHNLTDWLEANPQ